MNCLRLNAGALLLAIWCLIWFSSWEPGSLGEGYHKRGRARERLGNLSKWSRVCECKHAPECISLGLCVRVCVCVCVCSALLHWHSSLLLHREKCLLSLTPLAVWLHWSRLCLRACPRPLELPATPGALGLPATSADTSLHLPLCPPAGPPARPLSIHATQPSFCGSQPLRPPLQTVPDAEDSQLLSAALNGRRLSLSAVPRPPLPSPSTSLRPSSSSVLSSSSPAIFSSWANGR